MQNLTYGNDDHGYDFGNPKHPDYVRFAQFAPDVDDDNAADQAGE